MQREQIAAIAAGLTKAQREALLASRQIPDRPYFSAGIYLNADRRVQYNLASKGLVHDYFAPLQKLTPLGLEVRRHLQENTNG